MSMFPTKILLATEGSKDAELATATAIGLARSTASELHVVHVGSVVPEHYEPTDVEPVRFEQEARRILAEQVRKIETLGGTIAGSHLRMGGVADEIVKLVEELGIGLVAVGSRGKGRIRRLAMGSVSDSVARHARCPVMVVRWKPVVFPAKILLATDASEEARLAATTSSDLAQRTGSELHVAHVGREVTHGALIAVGSRGLGKIGRARLGSVSTKVLQAARGPVLVYPRPGVTLGGVVAEGCVVKRRGKTWPCLGKSERSAGLRSSSPHAQGVIIPTKGRLLINPD